MNIVTGIREVIGEPLSAVSFVQDYVEFHFDGKIIRSLTCPILLTADKTYKFPEKGSRDGLCSLIGRAVTELVVEDRSRIKIAFVGEASLIIPLADSERTGPEAAHFVTGDNQPIEVW